MDILNTFDQVDEMVETIEQVNGIHYVKIIARE
jgi:hypothetical protein